MIYGLPVRGKRYPIRSLNDVCHEAQKESAAAVLNVPYTPPRQRGLWCAAASSMLAQIEMNQRLEPKTHTPEIITRDDK